LWLQLCPTSAAWRTLTDELFHLCRDYFFDPKAQALCEHYSEGWKPLTDANGAYVFEPGHHYEWAWLLGWYQDLTSVDCKSLRYSLYKTADKTGLTKENLAVDEVLSTYAIKKASSRFWPQCERIKAAVKLGVESTHNEQPYFARSADEALEALFGFFNLPVKGLWQDTRLEDGSFTKQDPKASSLYHIINAMYEYTLLRPKIKDDAV